MQLEEPSRTPPTLRLRLNAAACLLLAAGMPASASARAPADPKWQLEGSGLLYEERGRTRIVEPTVRITRLFQSGRTLSAQLALDAMSGASPTGALPAGRVQTRTTPSGNVETIPADRIPTNSFRDVRTVLDLTWLTPFADRLTFASGVHLSHEKDYASAGLNARVSVEAMQKLTTFTAGLGYNRDTVRPAGGVPEALSRERIASGSSRAKRVTTALVGVSRILTRRWMAGVDASRSVERGYLTEPYKVVSLVDPGTGLTAGDLTESRPAARNRNDVLASSVYHLARDIVYTSYRYYWDDWNLKSHTVDLKYRRPMGDRTWIQPHVRLYGQTAARFFTNGLPQGAALPQFASGDQRLGRLRTLTLGATYGFQLMDYPGRFSVRAEYMRQWGNGHPDEAIGVQRNYDLAPALNVGTVLLTYSVQL